MRELATVEKTETPPGWAWEKNQVGGAKLVRQGWHNFGSETERMLSINISDCTSYRVTTLENSGLRGISRLRVAYGQTQKQRAATFHDLKAEPDGWVWWLDKLSSQGVQIHKGFTLFFLKDISIGGMYGAAFYLWQKWINHNHSTTIIKHNKSVKKPW